MSYKPKGATLERRAHFDAGIEWLKSQQLPGQCFSQAQIAAACGVSHQAIQQIEYRAFAKLRKLSMTKILRVEFEKE